MAVVEPILTAFTGGELSKRLRGRVDAEVYKRGLSECLNFEPMPQGSLRMRCGTEYVAECPSADTRIIAFPTRSSGTFMLELSPLELRILDTTSLQFQSNAPDLIVGGSFDASATGWTFAGANRSGARLRSPGNYMGYVKVVTDGFGTSGGLMTQAVTLTAATDYTLSFELVDLSTIAGQPGMRVRIGTNATNGDVYDATTSDLGFSTVEFNSGANTSLYFSFSMSGATAGWYAYFDDVQLRTLTTGDTVITTPWGAEHLDAMQTVIETAKDRMVLVHPNVEPQVLTRNADTTWTLATLASLGTAIPAAWSGTNYPGVCEIYQSRLWLAATPDEGHRVWASRVGSIFDFTLTSIPDGTTTETVLPTDAIDIKVATKGEIRWMQSGRTLLLGTDLGEHSITSQGGFVSPADYQVRDESAFGSCAVQAVHAGMLALYVSADRRKVRGISYDLNSSGWNTRDITFVSEHITAGLVAEMHHARDPNGTIALRLADGTLALCTFELAESISAWWRLETGTIRSLASSRSDFGSYLWMAVERAGGLYLERLPMAETGAVYLDSALTVALTAAQTVVTGLDHLEGETVGIILDGFLEDDQVVTAGQVTLARTGASVTIGLRYTASATTLEIEGGNPRGTALAQKRRWAKAVLRINESALPLVDGERSYERSTSTTFDTPEALRDGFVEARTLGWENGGALTISQDLPFRTEVLALFGTLSGNGV